MKNLIISIIVFLFAINLYAQNGKYDYKWIRYDELCKADINDVIKIKSDLVKGHGDSLQCFYFKGKYWISLPVKRFNDKIWGQIFIYDDVKKILQVVSDSLINFSTYKSYVTERVFKDNLYYIVHYYNGKEDEKTIYGRKVVVIDTDNYKIKKEIFIRDNCSVVKVTEVNDMLYIYVQPLKKKFNSHYLFTFWMPRGRSPKYITIPDGNMIVYKFDKDFNLIEKEETNQVDESYK